MTAPRPSVWATRRARALRLAAENPHAAEILNAYAALTEVQERIAAAVPVERWLGTESDAPLVRLDRLPLEELLALFTRFLEQMADVGTEVMKAQAKALLDATSDERRGDLADALSAATSAEVPEPAFHARAFLETIATPLAAVAAHLTAEGEPSPSGERAPARCRICGGSPVAGTLRDHPGLLGARALVCGLCGSEQRIPRLTCAHCGETNAERLGVHEVESVPHVRLDECRSCGRYLKTVDLRRRGDAVPIVEELATVELDLWARERGLTKLHPNVFGL